jgi:hypothetical protein
MADIKLKTEDGRTLTILAKDGLDGKAGKDGERGEPGQKGDTGEKGEQGIQGERGIEGKPGKDGKDGKNGAVGPKGDRGEQGPPGKSLTKEDIDRIANGLNKTKKENFLFANSGVNEVVAGDGITIDNSNPQHPIISSSGSSQSSFETVSSNLSAYDYTINYNGSGDVSSIVYSNGVTKTLNYTADDVTSIVLSGSTPSGIELTKTLTYTSGDVTSISYV